MAFLENRDLVVHIQKSKAGRSTKAFPWILYNLSQDCMKKYFRIALLHDDVTIKTFIKILLFNARDHGRLAGTKQRKLAENRSKTGINSRREVE